MPTTSPNPRAVVACVAHGGGPLPILGDSKHAALVKTMAQKLPKILRLNHSDPAQRPKAIVLVTAHWQERVVTISGGDKNPGLLYDYGGFPKEAYQLKYGAPAAGKALAERLQALLKEEGLSSKLDERRGWDHGVFVPLLLIRPEADIPVLQTSVLTSEDPEELWKYGRALSRLRDDGVAVLGSGFASFHNTAAFFGGAEGVKDKQLQFEEEIKTAVKEGKKERWVNWRAWTGAEESHPRRGGGEHFSPLIVAAGASVEGEQGKWIEDDFMAFKVGTFYWGADEGTA